MKPTQTDLLLMKELQKDGRISYADLSTKLGITPKTVAKRVEKLIETNIITVRAQPNPFKLGLSASAAIAVKADPKKIQHICQCLGRSFYVNIIKTTFGRFDIFAIVYFPNWEMLHDFINNDLYTIDGVNKVEFFFIKDVYKRYERFFKKEPFAMGPSKLKDLDWTIIAELAEDGRVNHSALAGKLGIHVTTLYKRISALVEEKIIRISGVPNPLKLVYSASAFIMIDADPDAVKDLCNTLMDYPEVHFITTLSERSGMIVCIHATDTASLYYFLKQKLAVLKGINNTETFIGASVKKSYYGWLLGDA